MEKIEIISSLAMPLIVFLVALIILFGKKDYFSSFISGAKDGCKSAISLLPTMCALIVAVSMFTASGACDFIAELLSPIFDKIGLPADIFPLILTRPISGSASMATFEEIMSKTGPDSFASLCASVIMASSDTVVYVICVYFSTVSVKKTKYAFPIAFIVSIFAIFFSTILCRIFF